MSNISTKKPSSNRRRSIRVEEKDLMTEAARAVFSSDFHRDLFDLIKRNEDEFKDFVMDVSGDSTLFDTVMEKLLITTSAMSLSEFGEASTRTNLRALEGAASSVDQHSSHSSGSDCEDELEDAVAPLASDLPPRSSQSSKPSTDRRDQLLRQGSSKRMARRDTMREELERRQSAIKATSDNTRLEERLAIEIDHRAFLEDEITELERLLDEQEDEINELSNLLEKFKSKNKGLSVELKTKNRTILILEEKYSLLKSEHGALRTRNDNLQLKLAQAEEERSMEIMRLTTSNADGQEDIAGLKRELRDCEDSITDLQRILAEKDEEFLTLSVGECLLYRSSSEPVKYSKESTKKKEKGDKKDKKKEKDGKKEKNKKDVDGK